MRTFTTLKTAVGNNIQDTSTATATLIGNALNNAYKKAWEACQWKELQYKHRFIATSGTKGYNLPEDFGQDLFVFDDTNACKLDRMRYDVFYRENYDTFTNGTQSTGTPDTYYIDTVNKRPPQIMLEPTPNNTDYYNVIYIRKFLPMLNLSGTVTTAGTGTLTNANATNLTSLVQRGMVIKNETTGSYNYISADVSSQTALTTLNNSGAAAVWSLADTYTIGGEPAITDIDLFLEYEATASMWEYKRQFNKSLHYHQLASLELGRRIKKEVDSPNTRRKVVPYKRNDSHILRWGQPYDTI